MEVSIEVVGDGQVVAHLAKVSDAAATNGGATLEIYSPEPYAGGIETGFDRGGQVRRRAGGAFMFRRGLEDLTDGFDREVGRAVVEGNAGEVTRVWLARGRRALTAIQAGTPVRSGRLQRGIAMRVKIGGR